MEISKLKALARPLKVVLDDGDGNPLGEIVFRYLPGAITKQTLPAFIALDDEPLAQVQRDVLAAHLESEQLQDELVNGSANGQPLTMESLDARIDARRAAELQPHLARLELASKKLCLLLDPDNGHDLTHDGARLPVEWQSFADHLPLALIETVTNAIVEAMRDPFGLARSLQQSLNGDSAGARAIAPANGDDS